VTPRSTRGAAAGSGVQFGHSRDAFSNYDATLKGLIQSNRCRNVCEVGGGANPALPLDYLSAHRLRYCVLDVAEGELAKAPAGYEKIVADICDANKPAGGPFDLVFSKMVAEHVRQPLLFHRNVHSLLRPGGLAFHFFPTLYAFPFLVNLLLPERAAALALRLFSPRDPVRHRKFPANYRWCRGPTAAQRRRFEQLGYIVERYVGFFGHGYYEKIPLLGRLQRSAAGYLVRHPLPLLTSFAYVILRKANAKGTVR
jgi:SAM-dependent methyltransferase